MLMLFQLPQLMLVMFPIILLLCIPSKSERKTKEDGNFALLHFLIVAVDNDKKKTLLFEEKILPIKIN